MRRIALVSATLGVAAVALYADQVTFRSKVETVRVDVVVTDNEDQPITNLTQADFSISENKHPQTITNYQFVSVPLVRRNIDSSQPQPPEPDVATNVPPSPKSRVFAIVIDDLHIIEQDIVQLKEVMREFVRT